VSEPAREMEPAETAGRRLLALAAVLVASLVGFVAVASAYVAGGWLVDTDERISAWVASTMPVWAEWVARVLSWIGGVVGVTVVCVVAVAVLWLGGRALAAALVVVSVLGVQLLVLGLKHAYERPRPVAGSPIDLPGSFSFPSGHAATGIAVFGLLGLVAARRGSRTLRMSRVAAGLALGGAIGASRVVLNVHYASDVIAGYLVGLSWLAAVLLAHEVAQARHVSRGAG